MVDDTYQHVVTGKDRLQPAYRYARRGYPRASNRREIGVYWTAGSLFEKKVSIQPTFQPPFSRYINMVMTLPLGAVISTLPSELPLPAPGDMATCRKVSEFEEVLKLSQKPSRMRLSLVSNSLRTSVTDIFSLFATTSAM